MSKLYANIAFYMQCKIKLVPIYLILLFRSKKKRTFRNKTMKLQSVHYKHLAVKSFEEKYRLKVLH